MCRGLSSLIHLHRAGLKVFHCYCTHVSVLPAGLHQLTQLEELRAHHCRLQTIDGRIGLLPRLRVIDCTANPVWSPPADALSLDTPELMRVLAALAMSQPSRSVSSHILSDPSRPPLQLFDSNFHFLIQRNAKFCGRFRNRKCQLLSVDWDAASARMVAKVRDVNTGEVKAR